MTAIKIIECPRDAMQGIKTFIPTEKKVQYIQSLLRVGFDTIDFGSFVSPKAIPQMQDTAEVLAQLDLSQTTSKLLAIIANTQGAEIASKHKEIQYLGFPFSISENFQMRNTHKTIAEALISLQEILEIADKSNKEVVTYISMGFGNPYGDPYNVEIVGEWTEKLAHMGVKILSLSDTIGSSTTPDTWFEKVDAAYKAGCLRFDGAIKGYGGCPMAKDDLTGNMPTEKLLSYFTTEKAETNCHPISFESSYNEALKIFNAYH